eukprot:1131808-Pleurochrysis_carterae.AAC.5
MPAMPRVQSCSSGGEYAAMRHRPSATRSPRECAASAISDGDRATRPTTSFKNESKMFEPPLTMAMRAGVSANRPSFSGGSTCSVSDDRDVETACSTECEA